jgi:WD40 repeat protein
MGNGRSLYISDGSGGYVMPVLEGAVPRKVYDWPSVIAPDPKGERLATACCQSITVLSTASWKPLNAFSTHRHKLRSLEFTSDGALLALCNNDGISFWDPLKGEYLGFFESINPGRGISDFAFGIDDHSMLSSDGSELWLWDYRAALKAGGGKAAKTASFRRQLASSAEVDSDTWCNIACATGVRQVFFSISQLVVEVDLKSKGNVDFLKLPRLAMPPRQLYPPVSALHLSSDGKKVMLKRDAHVEIYDTETRNKVSDFTNVGRVAFSSDGKLSALVDPKGKNIEIRLLESGVRDVSFPVDDPVAAAKRTRYGSADYETALGFSDDSKYLLVSLTNSSSLDSRFIIWDTESGKRAAIVPSPRGRFDAFRFSPNGSLLATMNVDGSVTVWSMAEILRRGVEEPSR